MPNDINKYLIDVLNCEPLTVFTEPTNTIDAEQKTALAEAYSHKGFRDYLQNAINTQVYNAGTKSTDLVGLSFRQGRASALKELLSLTQKYFTEFEKIKKTLS